MSLPGQEAPVAGAALPPELVRRFLDRYGGDAPTAAARKQLQQVLETAARNPMAARAVAEQWRKHEPLPFLNAVREALLNSQDEGANNLVCSLVDADTLVRALQDPRVFSREEAIELARALAPYAPDLDLRLAKRFSGERTFGDDTLGLESIQRTLDLITVVDCRERILPFLVRACRTPDRKAVSKVARLAGRCAWGRGLVLALLEAEDPRVRANAVEGLWEAAHDGEKAKLLWRAADDPHHRVAVNALVGLAQMGNAEAVERLIALTADRSAEVRAAAAWGLGELGEPRFRDVLMRMYQNETGGVRRNALRALVRLKQAEARTPTAREEPE
jgi:hypothetical protein